MKAKLPVTKKILYLIIYCLLYGSLVSRYLWSNTFITLVPDILLLILVLFFKVPKKKNIIRCIGPGVVLSIALFLSEGVISSLINYMPPLSVLWGVRMFLRYYLLLYYVYHFFDSTDISNCRRIFNQSMVWCFIFCFIQLMQGDIGDIMGGITSGNGELSIYIVICMIYLSSDYFRGILKLRKFILFTLLFYFCSMWAEIKLLYFIIPFIIYATYALQKKIKITHLAIFLVSAFFLVPTLKFLLSFYYGEQYVKEVFDEESVRKYTSESSYGFTDLSFNRDTAIPQAQLIYLKDDPVRNSVGYGIGSASVSNSFGTWIKNTADETFYYYFASSYVLIETGWIGLVLFLLIYVTILLRFFFIYIRSGDAVTKYWSAQGLLLALMTFIFFWYNSFPYANWYLPFLVWGFCFVMINNSPRK